MKKGILLIIDTLNNMNIKHYNNSIFQASCSFLIFIACFLPWMDLKSGSYHFFTVSLFQAIAQINEVIGYMPELSIYYSMKDYTFILYLIPVLSFINMFLSLIHKLPVFSFYANILPTGITYALLYYSIQNNTYCFEYTGIGFIITLIIGTISIFSVWTHIGNHYYRYHKYAFFTFLWSILSIIFLILQNKIIWKMLADIEYEKDPNSYLPIVLYIQYGISFFSYIGILHFPFLMYGWIVALISKIPQDKPASIRVNLQKKNSIKKEENTVFCSSCGKEITISINFCPHCGYCLSEVYHKRQEIVASEEKPKEHDEKNDLRFAPPQYRKE
jgi:hypothetical protein